VLTRNSSSRTLRGNDERNRNFRISVYGVTASSSGVEMSEKHSSRISMNVRTPSSTNKG